MGAIDQYLELYKKERARLDAGAAEPINALRERAFKALENKSLPTRGEENYAYFDLESALAPDYGLNLDRRDLGIDADSTFHCDVPVSSQSVLTILNDTFAARKGALDQIPDGVDVGSLRDFARLNPGEVASFYGRIADMENPLVALDTLLAQDGLYLRVRAGVKVERPIQLVNILSSTFPLMAVRRVLVIIEQGAEATLLACDHTQGNEANVLALNVLEIQVGRDARFDYYDIEESTTRTTRLSALYLRQEAGSEVTIDGLTLFNGRTRNEYFTRFEGEHASLKLYGMGIEDKERILSTYSHIDHRVPRCKSDELFKYSIDDDAQGEFTGRIHVAPMACGTEAYQANRNLVAHKGAKMNSKPQLEIYNDDVKCSHGCAIGQLDPLEVFYMRTRGLTEQTARRLLRQAFMADVLGAVRIETLRDRLHMLIERRFAGLESACGSCPAKR